ncbi:DUF3304 domain-containing protein [Cupriavidus sp. 2MCAB6]|uniref:DUF3304 domain-containing protein n=1 Tax=Cupriavidus sp. 2MCAB6 TaxID=3232981 RepID=UPI003F90B4FC
MRQKTGQNDLVQWGRTLQATTRCNVGRVAALLAWLLAGCAGGSGISTDRSDKFVYASLGGVNHTAKYIHSFSIDGQWGGNMDAYGSTSGTCCVGVPRVYRPGMQVKVSWNAPEGRTDVVKTKVAEVEPYTEAGTIYAHIFQDDVVRVVISARYDSHSLNHPIPYPVNPNKSKEPQQ